MSGKTSLAARVPALSINGAAFGEVDTASGAGTTLDLTSDLADADDTTVDVTDVNGLVAFEFDNSRNDTAMWVNIGTNTTDLYVPGGTSRVLVINPDRSIALVAEGVQTIAVIAYVKS